MARHALERRYGLTSAELLDAVNARFRLRVALEGGVAECHMAKLLERLVGSVVERYEQHDLDGYPDFSIWLAGHEDPLLAECKNVRESAKSGGEAYRVGGKVVAYKVETQKTRAAKGDPTSRYYGVNQYHILGVCLGKKTNDWSDFLFARTIDLKRHKALSRKLAVMQRVPLLDADELQPWFADLGELLQHFDDPPWRPHRSTKRS